MHKCSGHTARQITSAVPGCPGCGNEEIYQIYADNLPRGAQDSTGYEMAIACPECGMRLVVVDTGDEYDVTEDE